MRLAGRLGQEHDDYRPPNSNYHHQFQPTNHNYYYYYYYYLFLAQFVDRLSESNLSTPPPDSLDAITIRNNNNNNNISA